jgi:hypothetical protein
MRRIYSELYALNNELIGEYTKRSTNHVVSGRFVQPWVCSNWPFVRKARLRLSRGGLLAGAAGGVEGGEPDDPEGLQIAKCVLVGGWMGGWVGPAGVGWLVSPVFFPFSPPRFVLLKCRSSFPPLH